MTEYEDRLLDEIDRLEVARIVLQEIGGIEETKEWVDTKLIPTLVEKKSELSGSVNNKVDELKSLQSEIRKKEKEIEDRKESISYLVNLREEKTKRIEEIQLEIRAKEREISEKEEALRQRKEEIKNLEIKTEEEARNLERKTEECCGRFRGIKESYYDVIEKISQDSDDAKRFLIDHMDDVKDYDALDAKLGLSKLVEKYDDDLPYLTVVKRVRDYLWLKGRRYPQKDHIVERFMSAIGSHQIILVAGKPGSGKTTLPECIAEAVGARFERMVVQPNWTDNEDILGYYNHEDKTFIPTVFFDTVKNACENPDEQYFLLLDELNLAHVEYYLSSVLSVMERAEGTKLIEYVEDGEKKSYPLPKNLLIIGTINMDALSKAISPKVIDRSYVIDLDFSREEIDATDELEITDKVEPLHLSSHYYVEMCSDDVTEEMNQIEEIVEKIRLFYEEETKNGLLHGAPICFSPRCRTRSLYMLSHGANVDDILIGKILTQINWELENEHVYKRFMELFDGQDDRLRKKIRDMKDSEENVCFLDYWMTTRR